MVTVAPATGRPPLSVTRPEMVPVGFCAAAGRAAAITITATRIVIGILRNRFTNMEPPDQAARGTDGGQITGSKPRASARSGIRQCDCGIGQTDLGTSRSALVSR